MSSISSFWYAIKASVRTYKLSKPSVFNFMVVFSDWRVSKAEL